MSAAARSTEKLRQKHAAQVQKLESCITGLCSILEDASTHAGIMRDSHGIAAPEFTGYRIVLNSHASHYLAMAAMYADRARQIGEPS